MAKAWRAKKVNDHKERRRDLWDSGSSSGSSIWIVGLLVFGPDVIQTNVIFPATEQM